MDAAIVLAAIVVVAIVVTRVGVGVVAAIVVAVIVCAITSMGPVGALVGGSGRSDCKGPSLDD